MDTNVCAHSFQSVASPDGLFMSMFGPVVGRRHDSYLLRESALLKRMEESFVFGDVFYKLYGDPAMFTLYVSKNKIWVGASSAQTVLLAKRSEKGCVCGSLEEDQILHGNCPHFPSKR